MFARSRRIFSIMSGPYTINAFEQRAHAAKEKLDILKLCLGNLQQNMIFKEEEHLKQENKRLLTKVSLLKKKLSDVELENGSQQVAIEKLTNNIHTNVKEDAPEPPKKVSPPGKKASEPKRKGKGEKQTKQPKVQEAAPVDVSRLDFRVAQIVNVKYHPDADSLYVEQIQTGEESLRTVVTGVVKHVPIELMENRMVVLMCNLKPAKVRGILSQAMIMCANCPEKVEIIDPPPGAVPGDRILFEGYPGTPDALLNPKKKVWERIQPDLHTNTDCVACYKGIPFTVEGKGICKVQTLTNCGIK